ncbi:hypothetical protein K438DRAFT_1997317 [Mycena galopus ATCC 62051]|nr:hypothetical protein K438DRAFT_1997317 [Mycena galopus ATCC 62051]
MGRALKSKAAPWVLREHEAPEAVASLKSVVMVADEKKSSTASDPSTHAQTTQRHRPKRAVGGQSSSPGPQVKLYYLYSIHAKYYFREAADTDLDHDARRNDLEADKWEWNLGLFSPIPSSISLAGVLLLKTAIPLLGLLVVVAKLSRAEETAQMPWNSRRQTNGTLSATVSPTNWAGCDASQKSQLQQAFKDTALLASKGVNFDVNLMASMEFFGAPIYVQEGNHMIIQNNFARAVTYQPRWNDRLRNRYLIVTCSDPSALCGPSTPAYHVDPEPTPHPVLNFCPLFFEQRSLAKVVEYAMLDRHRRYDLRSYDRNQGSTFLHQILHISAVGQPSITDIMETTYEEREYGPAIGPLRCKYLVYANERNNVAETIRNADSYVQFAMAMFVQEEIGYPQMPAIWEPEEVEGQDLDTVTMTFVRQGESV